jgi:shikimate dehydrogenase
VLERFFEFDEIRLVSRTPASGQLSYGELQDLSAYKLVVNTTPVGQFPQADEKPALPYASLRRGQHLYDLIYNPDPTAFLQEGMARGCHTHGGLQMLILQAERAWEIWQG